MSSLIYIYLPVHRENGRRSINFTVHISSYRFGLSDTWKAAGTFWVRSVNYSAMSLSATLTTILYLGWKRILHLEIKLNKFLHRKEGRCVFISDPALTLFIIDDPDSALWATQPSPSSGEVDHQHSAWKTSDPAFAFRVRLADIYQWIKVEKKPQCHLSECWPRRTWLKLSAGRLNWSREPWHLYTLEDNHNTRL